MTERTPLLPPGDLGDHHAQFCHLVGARPVNHPHKGDHRPHPRSLYARAASKKRVQHARYVFTAALFNFLLLAQVVLGAALTGLGATDSSRVLITVFGALNTIIAGLIAYLKSRGQPMRARMFRDDLSRVVDEIESSAVMWYGISASAHGYDAIDTDEQVTVRGEVARLTRLYDKAVRTNMLNDPDMYSGGQQGDMYNAGLRKHPAEGQHPAAAPAPSAPPQVPGGAPAPGPVTPPVLDAHDPDASPASQPPKPKKEDKDDDSTKGDSEDDKESKKGKDDDKKDSAPSSSTDTTPGTPTAEEPGKGDESVGKGKDKSEPPAEPENAPPATAPDVPETPSEITTKTVTVVGAGDPDASPATAAYLLPKKENSTKTLVEKDI